MESSEPGDGPRHQIIGLLADDARSAPDLAELLGLHVTTVRFHLDRLVAAGVVARRRSTDHKVGRPRLLYLLVSPSDAPEATASEHLQDLAQVLLSGFHPDESGQPVSPEAAGERWSAERATDLLGLSDEDRRPARTPGQWLGKVGRIMDLLEAWGYRPELERYDGGRSVDVRLVDCPFLDLARADPGVVCGIHAGVVKGALNALGEAGAEVTLEPFTDPPLCTARLASGAGLVANDATS